MGPRHLGVIVGPVVADLKYLTGKDISLPRARVFLPKVRGGTEPLANRIITLPQDAARVEACDPHSGFIAYVPPGSIKKGEALAKGGSGKTIACAICPGEGLKGLGDVPGLASIHPIYIVRQLFDFHVGPNSSSAAAQMKKVVEKLSEDDIVALTAYAASLNRQLKRPPPPVAARFRRLAGAEPRR